MNNRTFAIALLALLAIAAAYLIGTRSGREEERLRDGVAASRIIEVSLAERSKLVALEMKGRVQAVSSDPGFVSVLRSDQRIVAPFSVGYTVDLAGVGRDDMRWNSEERTLYVDVPAVKVEPVNVDESQKQSNRTGLWVTERASAALDKGTSAAAQRKAQEVAAERQYVARAEDNARKELTRLLGGPLAAAGLGNVRVVVRFPIDRPGTSEQWDRSRRIEDVLNELQAS